MFPTISTGKTYGAFFPWKALLYPEKCRAILRGEFPPPVTIHVYPTNRCNNNCDFCIMRRERLTGGDLKPAVAEKIVAYANANGVGAIHVSGGGEPTLWNGDMRIFGAFKGTKVLSTNGRALSLQTARLFDRIRISVNAGTAATYETQTGTPPGTWDYLVAGITDICQRPDRPTGQEIGLGFVATPANWREIPMAIRLAQDVGADFVHIRPAYYPRGTVDDAEIRRLAAAIWHCCEACEGNSNGVQVYGSSEKFAGYWSPRGFRKCKASPLHAVIAADGRFLVCQDVFERFGDLNNQGFREAWESPDHAAAIARINVDDCPRCVMGRPNEILEHIFERDEILAGLL